MFDPALQLQNREHDMLPYTHIPLVTGSNECRYLTYQLVFTCTMSTAFDEMMSVHQYIQGCYLSNARQIWYRIAPSQGVYSRHIFGDVLVFQWCLADIYDRSPSKWALHADIHGQIFLEIKSGQRHRYRPHYLDVRVITCSWRNSNQVMYADDLGFFVVCFQIFSLKSGILPYLYRCHGPGVGAGQ